MERRTDALFHSDIRQALNWLSQSFRRPHTEPGARSISLFEVSPVTMTAGMGLPSIPNVAFGIFSKGYDISACSWMLQA